MGDVFNGLNVTLIGTGSDIFCQQELIGEINICLSSRYYERIILPASWYNFCSLCLIVIN
jgi:hypothetical protein